MSARERLIEFMVNNTPLPEEEVVPLVDEVEAEAYAAGYDDGSAAALEDIAEEDGQ